MRLAVNIDHIAQFAKPGKLASRNCLSAALVRRWQARGSPSICAAIAVISRAHDLDLLRQRRDEAERRDGGHVRHGQGRLARPAGPGDASFPSGRRSLRPKAGSTSCQTVAVKDSSGDARGRHPRRRVSSSTRIPIRCVRPSPCADAIEINTGRYTDAKEASRPSELVRIVDAAKLAVRHELEVLAGHGLNHVNVIAIAAVDEIVELNIGHSIVARAVLAGMDRAVRDMVSLLRGQPRF
jgi:hypothetical protein